MFTHLNSKKGAVSTPQNLKGRKTIKWEGYISLSSGEKNVKFSK